ncbi:MAG: hypothetical protein WBQ10_06565 [Terriglobales bacterium]
MENETVHNSHPIRSGDAEGGSFGKHLPMIVNGKVYVGTTNGVAVFGLLKH